MPNRTFYVDQHTDEQIRAYGIDVGATCRAALRRKIKAAEREGADENYARRAKSIRERLTPAS